MKQILKFLLFIILIFILVNVIVTLSVKKYIVKKDNLNIKDIDCILILGASVTNNKPSPILKDRLNTGINLYQNKLSNKILVSGDNETDEYDEVTVMKNYLIENNIESQDIFVDHYGISTYDSIYRLKHIYKAKKVIIVTQKYHLYRSLYIAKSMNIEAYGVEADNINYQQNYNREIREFLARIKDFIKCLKKSQSKYLGEVYLIEGNGDTTNKK